MSRPIYLDHHATTPVDPRVVEAMAPYWSEDFGNAASRAHAYGWRAEAAVELAREELAEALGAADLSEIVFTSGATESNNLALQGIARGARAPVHLVTVATEHPSVLDPCSWLERQGHRVTRLPVDAEGLVDPAAVAAALEDDTALVSVMLANNEIGVIQPLEEIGRICAEGGVPLHSDATQALGKIPVRVAELGTALLSVSAHKLYGPKGIGALYVRRRPRLRLEPLFFGGGHERGLRSGTLPVPLIVGFAAALRIALEERETEAKRVAELRERLWRGLEGALEGVRRNGHLQRRLPGNLHLSFEGVDGDALVGDLRRLAVSTGSACSSASAEPSHVLRALGIPEEQVRGGLRIGIGRFNDAAEMDAAVAALVEAVERLRRQRRGATGAVAEPPAGR